MLEDALHEISSSYRTMVESRSKCMTYTTFWLSHHAFVDQRCIQMDNSIVCSSSSSFSSLSNSDTDDDINYHVSRMEYLEVRRQIGYSSCANSQHCFIPRSTSHAKQDKRIEYRCRIPRAINRRSASNNQIETSPPQQQQQSIYPENGLQSHFLIDRSCFNTVTFITRGA